MHGVWGKPTTLPHKKWWLPIKSTDPENVTMYNGINETLMFEMYKVREVY
jgi:hypothetical protein